MGDTVTPADDPLLLMLLCDCDFLTGEHAPMDVRDLRDFLSSPLFCSTLGLDTDLGGGGLVVKGFVEDLIEDGEDFLEPAVASCCWTRTV